MRRMVILFLCCLLLTTTVLAASETTRLENFATVSSDGSCQVTIAVTVHLEEATEDLYFPIPRRSSDITLNGSPARAPRKGDTRRVQLDGVVGGRPGDYSFNIPYMLDDVVVRHEDDGKLYLEVPLLSGFPYPVRDMEFGITLPGGVEARPSFTSGYFQESIEASLSISTEGATISGHSTDTLKDHETLTMVLEVSEAMFPQSVSKEWSAGFDDVAMVVCGVLALVYWIFTLRCLPPRHIRRSTAPDGITAGSLGTYLTQQGTDLTMLVVSWAQMGYILIQLDDNGRVLLHKRMEMGNERPGFECHTFRKLFGKRRMVDGTGYHYAQLCRKLASDTPNVSTLFTPASGNPRIFRFLAALTGAFCGMSLSIALAGGVFSPFSVVVMMLLGTVSAWLIQGGCGVIHLRDKLKLWIGLGAMGLWLILGAFAGEFTIALSTVGVQLLAGFAACYGGRRSEVGKAAMAQILGLRRFMVRVSHGELLQISRMNPGYFYEIAPYALAMGVDKGFAKRWGKGRLPECSYLTTGMDGHLTAPEWCHLLREAVTALDARQKRMPLERFTGNR